MKFGRKKQTAKKNPEEADIKQQDSSSNEKQNITAPKEELEIKPQETEGPQQNVKKSASGVSVKILFIGLPLFILQVAAIYFITANILLTKSSFSKEKENGIIETAYEDTLVNSDLGKHVFLIEDIIINPSGSEGERLLLTSLGFDTKDEESQRLLKSKEVILKDIVISTFSSKTWKQLNTSSFKDSLKAELTGRINRLIPNVKLNTVYFSKYIAQ